MGILDNLENAWDADFLFESKPMSITDNMGRDTILKNTETLGDKMNNTEEVLTAEHAQAILLFQIEQKLRQHIALQVESQFHDTHHDAAHDIAQYIRNI